MTIEIKKNAEATIIEIVGRLDTITAPELEKTINEDIGDAKNIILDVLAGQMSPLYKELLDEGLVNNNFSTEYFNGYNYAAMLISGESVNPQAVADKVKARAAQLKRDLISQEDFETVRKKQYGKTVRAFSDIDTVANALVVSHFEDDELFSEFAVIKEMTLDYVNEMLLKSFDEDKAVLSVVCSK